MNSIGIIAQAYVFPEDTKSVEDVFRDEDVPFGTLAKNIDFRRDIGIDKVYVTKEMPSTLAIKASRKALKKANLKPQEIDLVVDFTSLPEDYIGPTWSIAGLIQKELNLENALATSVNTGGCGSYHAALKYAMALMNSRDDINTVLLAAGDRTPDFNKTYYPITVASDVGGAFILRKGFNRSKFLGVEVISIGQLHDVWYVPGLQNRESDEPSERLLYMHTDIEKFNKYVIPKNFLMFKQIAKRILERFQITLDDIDYFIYPTFSAWDHDYFLKCFGISPEKVYTDGLKRHGHVQENDMIINYLDAIEQGYINKGDLVLQITNGAGFDWAAALIKH